MELVVRFPLYRPPRWFDPRRRFTVYGNCVAHALAEYLMTNTQFRRTYVYLQMEPSYKTDAARAHVWAQVKSLRLFLYTPSYKNTALSTQTWIDALSKQCHVVGLARCYVTSTDLTHLRRHEQTVASIGGICISIADHLQHHGWDTLQTLFHRPQHPAHALLCVLADDILRTLGIPYEPYPPLDPLCKE